MKQPGHQVLAVVGLVAGVQERGEFSTGEVSAMFTALRLPARANLSRDLGNLLRAQLLMRPSPSTWALTPLGETRLHAIAPTIAGDMLTDSAVAEMGGRRRAVVPPFVASGVTPESLARLTGGDRFDRNIMLITRFPKEVDDPIARLIPAVKKACAAHDMNLHVASDAQLEDELWANVVTYMWGCRYAIVVLDAPDASLNSNVLIEIGGMLMTGRRCAVLKDVTVPALPTDLVGHIYKEVELSDTGSCLQVVHDWLRADLGLGRCGAGCGD